MPAEARAPAAVLVVPEVGPSLGRLVAPLPAPAGTASPWLATDDLRVRLASQLFELAGDARRWAREGERELALATVGREAWNEAWAGAVQAVAERAAGSISERLLAAAAEARLPGRRIRELPLDARETAGLAARLAAGSAPFHQALAELERAAHAARSDRAPGVRTAEWQAALTTVARRLEAAWLSLEETLAREGATWEAEVQAIRAWRRPRWPLILVGALLFGAALYAGLVLGGYLPVPDLFRGPVEAVWQRWN